MVGLGEQRLEVHQVMDDMRSADVDFLTMGQYLQPTPRHAKVEEFVTPAGVRAYAAIARAKGFLLVAASPLTRSSYHAGDDFEKMRAAREAKLAASRRACMPRHTEKRVLPYTPEQMFDLVADVGRYQEFLPWVAATRIRSDSETEMVADLVVGFSALKETFTSRVQQAAAARDRDRLYRGPAQISAQQLEVPRPRRAAPRSISASISPSGTALFEALAGQMFDRALRRMIGAFEERARALYGDGRLGQQQLERAERRLKADAAAARDRRMPSVSATISFGIGVALGAGEDDGADRLAVRAAAGPGDAGDRHRDVGARGLERALRHRPGDRDRDRAERVDHVSLTSEQARSWPRSNR